MRSDFEHGSSTIAGLFNWINDRHRIYMKRAAGEPKPWTADPILQEFKFTNVFRQLDRGTVALNKMLSGALFAYRDAQQVNARKDLARLIVFNICWYRLLNLDTHAVDPGWCEEPDAVVNAMHAKQARGEKVFTSAHMMPGRAGEDKIDTFSDAFREAYLAAPDIVSDCNRGSMEYVFKSLLDIFYVGPFVAYEIVCDLVFTPLLSHATDRLTWANVGPGAKRGLLRLGMEPTLQSMRELYDVAPQHLEDHVRRHYGESWSDVPYPPFELREIEHCLCEFDKYERTRLGHGRPRQRFNGA